MKRITAVPARSLAEVRRKVIAIQTFAADDGCRASVDQVRELIDAIAADLKALASEA